MPAPSLDSNLRRRRLWIEWCATAILSTALLITLIVTGATTRLDNALYDLSVRLKHQPASSDIVIVAIDQASLARVGQWPWPRHAEADLIDRIARGGAKALGCHFLFLFPSTPADDQAVHDAMLRTKTYLAVPHITAVGTRPAAALKPIPKIASAVRGLGAGDAQADEDGIVRRTFLFDGDSGHMTPRMVLQMARLDGRGPATPRPPFRTGEMLIPFAGPPGTITTVSAISVLEGETPLDVFRNKFVLLGATAPDLLDNYPTPTSTAGGMPSVEVDANILNALLSGSSILPVSRLVTLSVWLCPLWLLLIALVRLGPRDNLWLGAAMSGLPLGGSLLGVVSFGVWVPPAPYLVTLAIVLPYWGWRRLNAASGYFAEELRSLERTAGGAVLAHSRSLAAVGGDVVLQQMTLLEETKRRISDLRRFVADVLANFPDPVLVVDRAGRILTVNQAASDFAGRIGISAAPNSPVEPILSTIAAIGRDSRPMWPPPMRSDMFGSLASARPLTGVGPSGRAYELRFTPTLSADDEPTGWIVHLADITPLVSAMRQREEALQLLSHDMRSPLAAILAILYHPDFQDAPLALRQRIEWQAGRTLDLADAFVRLAKAETSDYTLEAIDLVHVMQDAADAVWPLAQAAGVTVEFDPEDIEYVVLADRSLLTRALINLLDNAVKYSPPGKHVTCNLQTSALRGRPAVSCDIADTAGGMAPAQLVRLFRKFDSARDALNGSEGVGLGLALVHTVVTRHDGTIACESADGEGTVFTITLPLYDEAEAMMATRAIA